MADTKNLSKDTQNNEAGATAALSVSGERFFEIRVRGYLNGHWSEWLEGLEVKLLENGEMILFGPVVDQAALLGVLNKLNYLNLSLLSVNESKKKAYLEEK